MLCPGVTTPHFIETGFGLGGLRTMDVPSSSRLSRGNPCCNIMIISTSTQCRRTAEEHPAFAMDVQVTIFDLKGNHLGIKASTLDLRQPPPGFH